ncbi:MAG: extracellular solute-binding protein, partial [Brevinematales bacterium]
MRKLSALLVLALVAALFQSSFAAPRAVTMWTFAPNNLAEWSNQKADIEKNLGITLDITLVPQDAFVQKLQAVQMSGTGVPDIIEWLIENNRVFAGDPKNAAVEDLTPFTSKSKVIPSVVPGRLAWTTVGGHVYGLPHDVHPVIMIYNDTLWSKAGVNVAKIATWDQFFKDAAKLVKFEEKDGKPTHFALPSGNGGLGDTMWMIWQQTGAQIFDKKGNPTFTSKDFVAFVKWWKAQYATGVFTAWDWGNFSSLLKAGTLCSYTSPDWWVSQVDAAAKDGTYKFKVRSLPLYGKSAVPTSSWGGSFLAIPKGNKDVAGVYAIIEAMQYNKDNLLKRYPTSGMLPPFASIWGDASFKVADPRFGGIVT